MGSQFSFNLTKQEKEGGQLMKRLFILTVSWLIIISLFFGSSIYTYADDAETNSVYYVLPLEEVDKDKTTNSEIDINISEVEPNYEIKDIEAVQNSESEIAPKETVYPEETSEPLPQEDIEHSETTDITEYSLMADSSDISRHHFVVSGKNHVLRIKDGVVQAYGDNTYGQLGTGDNISSDEFVNVIAAWGNEEISQIETRGNTSYALTITGKLYAWGDNSKGQCGDGTTINRNQPVRAAESFGTICRVSAGLEHVVIQAPSAAAAFGDNTYGQLGTSTSALYSTTPVPVGYANISGAGDYQTYYSGTDSEIIGVGKNDLGQIGSYWSNTGELIYSVRKIVTGSNHGAVLTSSGQMYAWGDNSCGQLCTDLGQGTTYTQNPVLVEESVTDIAAGNNMTLYVKDGKTYVCGQDGSITYNNYELNFTDTCNDYTLGKYCFAHQTNGSFLRWGHMRTGDELSNNKSLEAIKINYDCGIVDIDAYRKQVLALDTAGNTLVWGEGYCSDGTDSMCTKYFPALITKTSDGYGWHTDGKVPNPVSVSRGKNHNLILDKNGDVWGFGSNSNYPMSGLDLKVRAATKMEDISDVKKLAAGTEFSIFLKNDGTMWGTGKSDKCQVGSELTDDIYTGEIVQITDKNDFKTVTAGEDFAAAIASDGVYTWGSNSYGQLGINSDAACGAPSKVSFNLNENEYITDVQAGLGHCIALSSSGNVYSWGRNNVGQLGIGNKSNKFVPTKVNISDVKYINAGVYQSYAIKNDGTVWGWGSGANYQLGVSNTGTNQTPKHITSLDGLNITKIVGADGYSIAVDKYGKMYSFGTNNDGGLGIYSQDPVKIEDDYTADINELNVYMQDLPKELTESIALPLSLTKGSQVSWSSDNSYYLSDSGAVHRPNSFANDETAVLTATVTLGDETAEIRYSFVIKKAEGAPGDEIKNITLSVVQGKKYLINISGRNLRSLSDVTFIFGYDGGKIEIVDAIARSKSFDTAVNTQYKNIKVVGNDADLLKFTVLKSIPNGQAYTGYINGVIIKAKTTGTTTISLDY